MLLAATGVLSPADAARRHRSTQIRTSKHVKGRLNNQRYRAKPRPTTRLRLKGKPVVFAGRFDKQKGPAPSGKAKGQSRLKRNPRRGSSRAKVFAKKLAKFTKALKRHKAVVKVAQAISKARFATTRAFDRLQARAPPWLATTMTGLRTYTLISLGAFSYSRIKRDTAFLTRYFAGSSVFSYGVLPSAIVVGLNPIVSVVIDVLVTPISFGVMVVRERYLRHKAGQRISLRDTAKVMFSQYKAFAKERHESHVAAAYQDLARSH